MESNDSAHPPPWTCRDHQLTDHDYPRPTFHVLPPSGWCNDPCGPFYYRGRYHLFYQHIKQSCQWFWGICWGHVTSADLVHWEHCPVAICPTEGWYDADGCWSGSVQVDPETSTPVMLYTGVCLKTNPHFRKPVPPEYDSALRFVETQLVAVPEDPDDPLLRKWRKVPRPWIHHPKNSPITAWRDPSFIERGDGAGREWALLLSSGMRAKGGCVLMYRSQHLTKGWYYAGVAAQCQEDTRLGTDWECPILVRLKPLPRTPYPMCFAPPGISSLCSAPLEAQLVPSKEGNPGPPSTENVEGPAGPNAVRLGDGQRRSCVEMALCHSHNCAEDVTRERPQQYAKVMGHQLMGCTHDTNTERDPTSRTGGPPVDVGMLGAQTTSLFPLVGNPGSQSGGHVWNSCSSNRSGDDQPSEEECWNEKSEDSPLYPVDPRYCWLFAISYDGHTNPTAYFMGQYDDQQRKYLLDQALGPMQLDLGRTLYAPNCWEDPQGRNILWGWMQEHHQDTPKPPCQADLYSYAGCLSAPRLLYQKGRRLVQMPLPEVAQLRTSTCCVAQDVLLDPKWTLPLDGVTGEHLDLELSFNCRAASYVGMVLESWKSLGEGTAVVMVDVRRSLLRVAFLNPPPIHDPSTIPGPPPVMRVAREGQLGTPRDGDQAWEQVEVEGPLEGVRSPRFRYRKLDQGTDDPLMRSLLRLLASLEEGDPEVKHVGGPINHPPGSPVHLRVLLDTTCLEVFTGSGEVLSTRVYRGQPSPQSACKSGISFFTVGGEAYLDHLAAYEMDCAWLGEGGTAPRDINSEEVLTGQGSGHLNDVLDVHGTEMERSVLEGCPASDVEDEQYQEDYLVEGAAEGITEEDLEQSSGAHDLDEAWWEKLKRHPSEEIRRHWWREVDAAIMAKLRGERYSPGMYLQRHKRGASSTVHRQGT